MSEFDSSYALARSAMDSGRFSEAARHCEEILKTSPAEAEAWFLRGLALASEAGWLADGRVNLQEQFVLVRKGPPLISYFLLQIAKRLSPGEAGASADLP